MNYLIRKTGATSGRGQPQSQWSATRSLGVYKGSCELSFTFTHLPLLLSCPRLHPLLFSLHPFVHFGSGHRLLLGTSLKVTGTGDASGLTGILESGGCSLAVFFRCRLSLLSLAVAFSLSVISLFLRLLGSWPHLLQHISRATSTGSSLQDYGPTSCHRPSTLLRSGTVLWLG